MNLEELLNQRKKELEDLWGKDLKEIKKSTKFLKLVLNQLIYLDSFFTKVEMLEIINKVFKTNVKYSNFYKFFVKNIERNELKIQNNNVNKKEIFDFNTSNKKREINKNISSSQVNMVSVNEFDDGELKIADKSDFK